MMIPARISFLTGLLPASRACRLFSVRALFGQREKGKGGREGGEGEQEGEKRTKRGGEEKEEDKERDDI